MSIGRLSGVARTGSISIAVAHDPQRIDAVANASSTASGSSHQGQSIEIVVAVCGLAKIVFMA